MRKLLLGDKDITTSLKMDGKYIDVAWPVYTSSIDIEYLVVAAGGGGGEGTSTGIRKVGGGGAAGAVNTGSFTLSQASYGDTSVPIKVGGGGYGGGGDGGQTYVGFSLQTALAAAGVGSGGFLTELPGSRASGGDSGIYSSDAISTTPLTGSFASFRPGGVNDFFDNAAGGGAGSSQRGGDGPYDPSGATATGGEGGDGLNITDWYLNSSLDVVGVIAGGGGGSAFDAATNTAGVGSDGGGNGAINSDDAGDATSFGSGGGGSYTGNGGDGHGGLIILRYQNQFPINDDGDEVFQVGDYWYHTFTTGSIITYSFDIPENILVSI